MKLYRAVTGLELVSILGSNCSPMSSRQGYVIGPDINDRLCHIATCFTLTEAKQKADELNAQYIQTTRYIQTK